METKVKDLSLLLLCLTGWEENSKNDPEEKIIRSWKGYPFKVLNELEDENLLFQIRNGKSIILTKEGEEKAEELKKKYLKK